MTTPTAAIGLTDDLIAQAVARGWCAPENSHKVMDSDLAYAIAREVAAIQQPPAAPLSGWMLIATAPKDGTYILLTNGAQVAQGSWIHEDPHIREQRDADGRYIDQVESDGFDGWMDFDGGMEPEPTHWMPLPPAPGTPAAPVEQDAVREQLVAEQAKVARLVEALKELHVFADNISELAIISSALAAVGVPL